MKITELPKRVEKHTIKELKIHGHCIICGKECQINNCNPLMTTCSIECSVKAAGWDSIEQYEKKHGKII